MSFVFRNTEGDRIAVVTKKGTRECGLPKGVIIPSGRFFSEKRNDFGETWAQFVESNHLFSGCAIHSSANEDCIITIRTNDHFVNRFGIFLSREDPFEHSDDNWDVTKGSIRTVRVAWNDFGKILKLL